MGNQYTACNDCQSQSLRHCAHPEECGNVKTYPNQLREMFTQQHKLETPLSVICQKAFDMAKHKINE